MTWPEFEIVGEASHGEGAIQAVGELQPDIVLMDVRMPKMNGIEATRAIKNRWPHVGVVILTVYIAYKAQAAEAGADAFIDKQSPSLDLRESLISLGKEIHRGLGHNDPTASLSSAYIK